MGDGSALLAFFQWADQDENTIELWSPGHVAFERDADTQSSVKAWLALAGHAVRVTDRGCRLSLYVTDPDELRLEFAVDHPDVEAILARQRPGAHEALTRWLAGDHRPNKQRR